jgi:hypothetical protein
MKHFLKLTAAGLMLVGLAACTATLNDQDRALLTSASQNAETAKEQATQANSTAQQALQAAQAAQTEAKTASDKADQLYSRSLRK